MHDEEIAKQQLPWLTSIVTMVMDELALDPNGLPSIKESRRGIMSRLETSFVQKKLKYRFFGPTTEGPATHDIELNIILHEVSGLIEFRITFYDINDMCAVHHPFLPPQQTEPPKQNGTTVNLLVDLSKIIDGGHPPISPRELDNLGSIDPKILDLLGLGLEHSHFHVTLANFREETAAIIYLLIAANRFRNDEDEKAKVAGKPNIGELPTELMQLINAFLIPRVTRAEEIELSDTLTGIMASRMPRYLENRRYQGSDEAQEKARIKEREREAELEQFLKGMSDASDAFSQTRSSPGPKPGQCSIA